MEEEGITFTVPKGVFYNPSMRLCRSMSSLAVGAIAEKLEVVDAFCASGIRGIRYAKENRNVVKLTSIDIEPGCAAAARKNLRAAKVKAASAVKGSVSRLAFEYDADFIELDPFGTPAPYVVDAFRYLNAKKTAYVSATATDVAVLCGGKAKPCMKHYGAKPLNNEFTHETGLRILIKKIVDVAAEFNMGVEPLASFSDQHYLKCIARVSRGADGAYAGQKMLGYVSWCRKCGWRGSGEFPLPCGNCGARNPGPRPGNREPDVDFAGPLWLGALHGAQFIRKMAALNAKRGYADAEKIGRLLSLMEGEAGMPPYYYNVHGLCALLGLRTVPRMEAVLAGLEKGGFTARRTHFSPVSIKSDAPYAAVLGALK